MIVCLRGALARLAAPRAGVLSEGHAAFWLSTQYGVERRNENCAEESTKILMRRELEINMQQDPAKVK